MAGRGARAALVGTCVLAASTLLSPATFAHGRSHLRHASHHHRYARTASYRTGHVIQCVTFARADTGIQLSGNAANWWDNAAGVYARGDSPEVGSVLNFRANQRMRLGHVAVVSSVVNSREVLIDQSHWASRGVSRDISVIDVSPDNDWTAVRVGLGHGNSYGSIYPTYGFIYARPDGSSTQDAGVISPARVRAAFARRRHEVTLEVAEAPEKTRGIDLAVPATITDDAPDRSLR